MKSASCSCLRDEFSQMNQCCLGRARDLVCFLIKLGIRSAERYDSSICTLSGGSMPEGKVHVGFPKAYGGW